jgi:hypothetical protein
MSKTRRVPRWLRTGGVAVALAGLAATSAIGQSASAAPASAGASGPQHIFLIMMENHGRDQILGNTADAPFINSLAARYNVERNYHGVTHPSLPNYLATFSGSFQGIFDDCLAGADVTCPPEEFVPDSGDGTDTASLTPAQAAAAAATPHMFEGKNLVDQVEASGRTWKAYMQSMPSVGYEGEYAPIINGTTVKLYAQKHNPFMYFSDINSAGNPRLNDVVPFENTFSHDLSTGNVPNFVWISPDQCHDMHGITPATAALVNLPSCGYPDSGLDHGAISLGDQFLQQTITQITSSQVWKTTRSSIVVAWDENDYSGYSGGPGSPVGANGVVLGGGDAPLLVINSAAGPQHVSNRLADHYTLLSTIEQLWHLGCLANTCSPRTSGSMLELFRP